MKKKTIKKQCEHHYVAVETSSTEPSYNQYQGVAIVSGTIPTRFRYYKLFCVKCGQIVPGPTP